MSDVLGLGSIFSAYLQGEAVKDATKMQMSALARQRKYVFDNLDPNVIGPLASKADKERALNQLALQGQIDPQLLKTRYAAEDGLQKAMDDITNPSSPSSQVAQQATKEALAGTPGMGEAKTKLVDEALAQLKLGASLPPDVEAEFVKAGLEKSGMVTGNAGAQGVGGTILRTVLGTGGLELQRQRQQQAAGLLQTAQDLDTKRQNILQTLFPSLLQTQLGKLGAAGSALSQSNSMVPQSGLSGTDVANIWLARVGATNQLAQSSADAAARGAMAQGNIWGNAIGGISRSGSSLSSLPWKQWFGSGGGGTGGGADLSGGSDASAGDASFGGYN